VDEDTDFEPDVAVHCGAPIPRRSLIIPAPIVVVEVVSPSSQRIDTIVKVEAYFRVPTIAHYLVFRADRRAVLHWRRGVEAPVRLTGGTLSLDPPGISLVLDTIHDRADAA
jgi:Uma2 family endonuclease